MGTKTGGWRSVGVRVIAGVLIRYLVNLETVLAAFVFVGAGLFLVLGWHWSGLEHRGEYGAFTGRAQGRVSEGWLALDFDAASIKNPKNWPFSVKAEACVVIEYGESWGAPLRRAFCGNQFAFEGFAARWPDLGDLSRDVPFLWRRDERGFALPEIRMDAAAYEWLQRQPPDETTGLSPTKTALDSLRYSKDLPVEAAALGWSTTSVVPLAFDPERPAGALPAAVVEARRKVSPSLVALLPGGLGLLTLFAGLSILPLTADLRPWLRWAMAVVAVATVPTWPRYLPRALNLFDAQAGRLFGEMMGDIDRTGRLVASEPEDATQAKGKRLAWRLEESDYADPLARFTFVSPEVPFPNSAAALGALTEAVSKEVRALAPGARAELFTRLRLLQRDGRKDAKGLFLPAAKAIAQDEGFDSATRQAAERFLSE